MEGGGGGWGVRKRRGGDVKWYINSSRSVSGAGAVIRHKSIIFPCTLISAVTLHLKPRREHFQCRDSYFERRFDLLSASHSAEQNFIYLTSYFDRKI